MFIMSRLFLLIVIIIFSENSSGNVIQDMRVHSALSRQKRYLVYPKGGGDIVQLILGFGLPIELRDQSITVGTVTKITYHVPNNSTYYTRHYFVNENRQKRAPRINRWHIYDVFSAAANNLGLGGKACVLQAVCETAATPFNQENGLFEELLHVILTPSSTTEFLSTYGDNEYFAAEDMGRTGSNCKALFPECHLNLLDLYTKII